MCYINKLDLDLYGPLALTKVQEANCWVHGTDVYFVTSQSIEGEFQMNPNAALFKVIQTSKQILDSRLQIKN